MHLGSTPARVSWNALVGRSPMNASQKGRVSPIADPANASRRGGPGGTCDHLGDCADAQRCLGPVCAARSRSKPRAKSQRALAFAASRDGGSPTGSGKAVFQSGRRRATRRRMWCCECRPVVRRGREVLAVLARVAPACERICCLARHPSYASICHVRHSSYVCRP